MPVNLLIQNVPSHDYNKDTKNSHQKVHKQPLSHTDSTKRVTPIDCQTDPLNDETLSKKADQIYAQCYAVPKYRSYLKTVNNGMIS